MSEVLLKVLRLLVSRVGVQGVGRGLKDVGATS